ncbi:MAG TPA: hypothetical protein VFH27_04565 [Longimicrobiaceae bacterium]|nr:hypothetical protein [Longimicrobiaceae bacterium]
MREQRGIRVALALAAGATLAMGQPAHAQTWRALSSARQRAGEQSLNVEMEYGAGTLRVQPAGGDLLYRLEMRYDEDRFRPVTEYDAASASLKLGLHGREGHGGERTRGGTSTLSLSGAVPVSLDLKFGAGDASLDLGGMALRRLRLSTGASETRVTFAAPNRVEAEEVRLEAGAAQITVTGLGNAHASLIRLDGGVGDATLDFGGQWTRDAEARLQMGMGSLTLRFPRGLGVRIHKDSFLASFDHPGMVKRGDDWFSTNWDHATRKVTLDIAAAMGSIDVEWTD